MPAKQEVSFPIFLECCQYTTDTYWESIFSDLAYGKAPYGSHISKGFLFCNYKKKEFSYKIEKKDAETIYNEVYKLLTCKLGIMSNVEKLKKKKDVLDIEDNLKNSRQEWGTIRKKNMKELFIELFVTGKQKEYSLSLDQARYLLAFIYIGLMFKVITSDDITYEDNRIIDIDGITFDKNQVFYERDLYNIEHTQQQVLDNSKLLSDSWEKYLKELKKLRG